MNYQYAYKISGSSQQIRSDKQLTQIYKDSAAPSGSIPSFNAGDYGRPIGWDGRSVHGCSIWVPEISWSETVEIPSSQYSFDYEAQVAQVALSPVNNASFRGYQANQVLFQGYSASVSTQNPDSVIAQFEFKAGDVYSTANGNAITIDNISAIAKNPWDWLDVHYTPPLMASGQTAAYPPKADYVLTHRVYDTSNFALLNIGTSQALPMWQGPVQ